MAFLWSASYWELSFISTGRGKISAKEVLAVCCRKGRIFTERIQNIEREDIHEIQSDMKQ